MDFDAAVSEEAVTPIADELEEYLSDKYDMDIEVTEVEVKHIIVRIDQEDFSTMYIAFTPDGRTLTYEVSADENIDAFIESLLKK
jgi:hypothetical protein